MDDWDAGGSGDGFRLGKRQSEKGEVEYKSKSGTAWSHSYLNQKPWHPLSYPNQRRKWIAEQTHANHSRRAEEVAREFSQEQEFFRQTSLFSQKEKEKMEIVKAVSFMYVRPPGYNAESAKAAEIVDEKKKSDENSVSQDLTSGTASCSKNDSKSEQEKLVEEKKSRPKDVFGRPLPTENEFEVLKNAPRLETGMPARVKPFGIEIRNVRCVRCGAFGHQSGDRECPLKDTIMPNDESRLKRDDPLTTIMAQTSSVEPVKWELKQKPGMSPPHGGFQPDDPNQQIVADEIFDEYGGFLCGGEIPTLLSNFSTKKSKKRSKNKSKREHKSTTSRSEAKLEYENQPKSTTSRSEAKLEYENQPSSSGSEDCTRENKRSKKKKNYRLLHHESDLKRRSWNKHGRPFSEVEHESRTLRKRHESSSDSDVSNKKTRSRKKRVARCSSDSEDRGGQSSDRHGKVSSDSEVDRRRKAKLNSKRDRSYNIDDDRKMHGSRSKYNRSPDSKIEAEKRRSNGRRKKMKPDFSASSDSESSDSTSRLHRRRRHN